MSGLLLETPAVDVDVNRPQGELLSLPKRFRGYVGGFGSGKTYVGCIAMCMAAWSVPGIPQGYFAPTYSQIRDIFYPTMEEVAEKMGFTVKIKTGDHEVHLIDSRGYVRSRIICRSMDNPASIVGFKIGRALVDELDILPMLKAEQAWNKIIARMRWQTSVLPKGFILGQIDVTTTPEGFQFMHRRFVQRLREKPELSKLYGLVQASTYENEALLPEGYIESLLESYPAQLVRAYLHGEFVNMLHGTVYSHYNRERNRCGDHAEEGEPVHIGMDFNVNKMAAIVHVTRNNEPRAVGELVNQRDTPAMIEAIKTMFWTYDRARTDWVRNRTITIYPDASGANTSSKDASKSDIALLQQAGFQVMAPSANPPVRDRVLAMNMAFCDNHQNARYKVNDDLCPTYAENLEQQAYNDNGEPDKKSGHDHTNDAGGYYIHNRFPIIKPVSSFRMGRAH
jgi:phage terminase large subunit